MADRLFAIVTGASSGIGLELARICAREGFDLLLAADAPELADVTTQIQNGGHSVHSVQVDLSTVGGVDALLSEAKGRPIDLLFANAGHGLGHAFADQPWDEIRHVIDTNITGTAYLLHRVVQQMRARNAGRILITGSIAGFAPGPFNAVYSASKAFVNSLSWALRNELRDTAVSVTCLMPGATETEFFARADLLDTHVGQSEKADPASVAELGFRAMMRGDGDVVHGLKNKIQATIANVTPSELLANQQRRENEPTSGGK